MPNKRILIVTYYWPPFGGSGVQRWLKFVKYLPALNWQPIVYTPENPTFSNKDESLMVDIPASVEIIKLPIWEPTEIFSRLSGIFGVKKIKQSDLITSGKKSLFQKLSIWIRGNLFVPDGRVLWVKPSVRFLKDFIVSNQIDYIVTTGPPHSMHLIGLQLKKLNPEIKWIADFRDPWSEWDLLDSLMLSSFARSRHRKKELQVLKNADRVVTIAPFHADRLKAIGGRRVDLITNGFDEDDFKHLEHKQTDVFTIRHVGNVDELRDPRPFLKALKDCIQSNELTVDQIMVEFIGDVNSDLHKEIRADEVLSQIVIVNPPVSHLDILDRYQSTDLQLLILAHTVIAPGNLPGKFFEYMASQVPILAIGPEDGNAAQIIRKTGCGVIHDRTLHGDIKESIKNYYKRWKNNDRSTNTDISKYSRKELTRELSTLLLSMK